MKIASIKGTKSGFFSCFRSTISTIYWCEQNNLVPYIDWTNTLFSDKNKPNLNAWEYYFRQLSPCPEEDIIAQENYITGDNENAKQIYSNIISKYVCIRPEILQKVNDFIFNNFNTKSPNLGIHYRKTDKITAGNDGMEPASGRPVNIDHFIQTINTYLNMHPDINLFISTDCEHSLNIFKECFPKIKYYNCFRSNDNRPIHTTDQGISPFKKGEDVLIDCLLLSKCDTIIKSCSNVSICSTLFNPWLQTIRMNEIYHNDQREKWIDIKF